jgi:lipoprotein-releasing system permease protein
MSFILKLAYRFALERKKLGKSVNRGIFSFVSSISVLGLTLGVTALLVVTSVINGFEKELHSVLTSFHGHILIFSKLEPVEDVQKMILDIKQTDSRIEAVSPYLFFESMLSSRQGMNGAVIEGVDLNTLDKVSSVCKKVIEGSCPVKVGEFGIALGYEIAKKLKVKVGDLIFLTIPFSHEKGEEAIVRKLPVTGILKLGMYDYDKKYAVMLIEDVQTLLNLKNKANAFKVLTTKIHESYQVAEKLAEKYAYPIYVKDWTSLNQNLFYAIRLEKVVIAIVLMAIVLVASFNVVSTLLILVQNKKRQIAMLKALGLKSKNILKTFLVLGIGVSLSGVFLGVFVSLMILELLKLKSIIDLPEDIYGLSRLPVELRPIEWFLIGMIVLVLSVLSAYFPSYRISKKSPIEGLKADE